jgi:hypothetical protein
VFCLRPRIARMDDKPTDVRTEYLSTCSVSKEQLKMCRVKCEKAL